VAILGQLTLNEILLLEVDADPSTSGVVAPIGSLAILDDSVTGKLWVKSGAGDTTWSVVTRQSGTAQLASGGVLFADASGFLSQDSMLFWDQTNKRLIVGSSTPQDITGLSVFPPFQILGTSATQMVVAQYSANIVPSVVNLLKSRGGLNAQGLVADGDDIGRLQFRASDGVNFQAAAALRAAVDGTPSAGSMPGRLTMWTTPTGSTTPLERARISQLGYFGINDTNPTHRLTVTKTTGELPYAGIATKNTDATSYAAIEYITPTKTFFTGVGGASETLAGLANKFFVYDFTAGASRYVIDTDGRFSINQSAPDASAQLQVDSTTRGFLPPRMTSAQRLAITTPASGLQVHDIDLDARCVYSGTHWTFEYDIPTTAIQTSTSNVYANITQWVTVSLEPGLYAIRLRGIMQSTALGIGVGLRLVNGTATISVVNINWTFSQGAAGTDKNFEYSQLALADNVTSASVVTANTNLPVAGDGVFRISVAGTIAIQIRSETNGTGVSIRPDSSVIFRKVGN
jgi:hypothetical protein